MPTTGWRTGRDWVAWGGARDAPSVTGFWARESSCLQSSAARAGDQGRAGLPTGRAAAAPALPSHGPAARRGPPHQGQGLRSAAAAGRSAGRRRLLGGSRPAGAGPGVAMAAAASAAAAAPGSERGPAGRSMAGARAEAPVGRPRRTVLAERNQRVAPVGAWVERAGAEVEQPQGLAFVSAASPAAPRAASSPWPPPLPLLL